MFRVVLVEKTFNGQGIHDLLRQLGESAHEKTGARFLFLRNPKRPVFVGALGIGAKEADSNFLPLGANHGKSNGLHDLRDCLDFIRPNWNAIKTHDFMTPVLVEAEILS